MDQIIIKSALILAFIIFAIVLLRPGGSARNQALRTVALFVFLIAAIVVVIFPAIMNDFAVSIGVGRGADLLLYAFIVVFIGNALSTARKRRQHDVQITELARKLAIAEPKWPEDAKK